MKKSVWLLGIILFIALFLRLFRLTELFHFTMDEELIAWRAWGLFKLHRSFLIGGISPLQIHLPPYFYYLMTLLIWPFNFNPVGWGLSGAIVGGLTIYALYCLTLKLFDRQTAITAVIFQTFSFTAVFFDRHFWPMSLSPLLTVLSLFTLTKIPSKTFWPYLFLALILLLALSADPSNLSLALAMLLYFLIRRRQINWRFACLSVLGLSLFFLAPLFLFDLRHDWQNFSGLTRLWQTASGHQFELNSLFSGLLLLPKTLARFWYSPQTSLIEVYSYCFPYAEARQSFSWLLLPAIGVLAWFMVKLKNLGINLLLVSFLIGLTMFGSLGFSLFDHYLTGLLPVFALITAVAIHRLPKLLAWLLILFFIVINLFQISRVTNPYGLKFKQELVIWANQRLAGRPYALDSISKCHRENGLRYLFELSGNPPTQSFMDTNFSWLYREPPAAAISGIKLLVADKPIIADQPIISQQQFGALNAYLLNYLP